MPNKKHGTIIKCGHRIKERSKIPVSICSTVSHIITKPATDLHQKAEFSPSSWLGQRSTDEIVEKINSLEESANNLFRQYRGTYISDVIGEVSKEQQSNDYQFGIRD